MSRKIPASDVPDLLQELITRMGYRIVARSNLVIEEGGRSHQEVTYSLELQAVEHQPKYSGGKEL